MMLKKVICIFLLLILVLPQGVSAAEWVDPNSAAYPSCSSWTDPDTGIAYPLEWCYSGVGYRFSAYYYDGSTLKKIGKSFDVTTDHVNGFVGRNAIKVSDVPFGRVDYNPKIGKTIDWNRNGVKLTEEEFDTLLDGTATGNLFDTNLPPALDYSQDPLQGLREFLGFDDYLSANSLLNYLKKIFRDTGGSSYLKIGNWPYLYITVEPTIYTYRVGKGYAYYGTSYELLQIPHERAKTIDAAELFGMDPVLYSGFPYSLITPNNGKSDPNKFVGKKAQNPIIPFAESTFYLGHDIYVGNNKKTNRNLVLQEGFGIGVYKLSDYVIVPTCSASCSASSENTIARLKCAEEYCQNDSGVSNTTSKKACIIGCGYAEPAGSSCATATTNAGVAQCHDKISASKTTCPDAGERYFSTSCIETTTLEYPDLVGKNALFLNKKYDFPYVISTIGTKKCEKKFNYNLFQFDYATQYTSTERNALKNNTFNLNYFKTNDTGSNAYKYNTTWQNLKLNNSQNEYGLKWDSIESSFYIKTTASQSIKLIANGSTTSQTKYKTKVYYSTNDGVIVPNDSLMLPSLRIPFITDSLTQKENVVNVKKTSSNLNSTNRCKYKPSDEGINLKCYAKSVTYNEGDSSAKATFVIEYTKKSGVNATVQKGSHSELKYSSGGSWQNVPSDFEIENVNINYAKGKTVVKTLTVKTNDGTKQYSCSAKKTFPDSCKINLSKQNSSDCNPSNDKIKLSTNADTIVCKRKSDGTIIGGLVANGNSVRVTNIVTGGKEYDEVVCEGKKGTAVCTDMIPTASCKSYKPNDYTNISRFCTEYSEAAGYASVEQCIKTCPCEKCTKCPPSANKTVHNASVDTWCGNSTNLSNGGYTSVEQCRAECYCGGGVEPGEYVFRPIELGKKAGLNPYNAFPNREAGANWVGNETKTEANSFESKPKYVITLDKDMILAIREDTKTNKAKAYIPYENQSKELKRNEFKSEAFLQDVLGDKFCRATPTRECD